MILDIFHISMLKKTIIGKILTCFFLSVYNIGLQKLFANSYRYSNKPKAITKTKYYCFSSPGNLKFSCSMTSK